MTEFTHVEGQEVWVHGRRVGIIVEEWFYPVPGAQLSAGDLGEIAKEMEISPLSNPAYMKPKIPEFRVHCWYDYINHACREAEIRDKPDIVWPKVGTTVRLDGELYILEKSWPHRPTFRMMSVKKVPPADFRQEHQNEPFAVQPAVFQLDEKSMEQAKGRLHRRPVENDQSDSVSRSMKPSGDL